jgi:hypothetical protein
MKMSRAWPQTKGQRDHGSTAVLLPPYYTVHFVLGILFFNAINKICFMESDVINKI